jgi:uncharacterized membrane protein
MNETTMNDGITTLATNTKPGRQVCNCKRPSGVEPLTVYALTHLLRLMVLAAGILFTGTPVFAGPQIEIRFETDSADSQKLIHAQAVFAVPQPVIYNIFNCITTYPQLHDWVRETTRVNEDHHTQVYLVKFSFPWPVGSQWSRVEVRHNGNTIFWKQVDGSLEANHGRISFTTVDSKVHLDYRAAIDVGLPELWTRSYKEKFIREFLTAAYNQAETTVSTSTLLLAVEP